MSKESAEGVNGPQPTTKPSRQQLLALMTFMEGDDLEVDEIKESWITHEYAPSLLSIEQLQIISLSDLKIKTHHLGKMLLVRSICEPIRIVGTRCAVEDQTGNINRLIVYNQHSTLDAKLILPEGGVFVVKEPFYKLTKDGEPAIRIDHPSDLIQVIPNSFHSLTKASLRIMSSRSPTKPSNFVLEMADTTQGVYLDMPAIDAALNNGEVRLAHPSHTSKVTVHDAGKHGRGLFTTVPVKAGDLVLVEKAFVTAYTSDPGPDITVHNTFRHRRHSGPHAAIIQNVLNILQSTDNDGSDPEDPITILLNLHDGSPTPDVPHSVVPTIDGKRVINAFRAATIVELNCFDCPDVRTSTSLEPADEDEDEDEDSTAPSSCGIWLKASHANHSCLGNVRRSFLGDLMVLRATRDLEADEEITMPYIPAGADMTKSGKNLATYWGIKECDCELCVADRATSWEIKGKRGWLVKGSYFVIRQIGMAGVEGARVWGAKGLEGVYRDIEATYAEEAFGGIPRLGLTDIGICVAEVMCASRFVEDLHHGVFAAIRAMRDFGYVVVIRKGILHVDRSHCLLDAGPIRAALWARKACNSLHCADVGGQFKELAENLYITLYGEMNGWDEVFSSI